MKKILSILLILAFTITSSCIAFANEVQRNSVNIKVNEYEHLKQLKSKSDDELKAIGFDKNEIEKVRKADIVKEISKRANLSDTRLKNMGYSKEQIKIFKNFKGTEEEVQALVATVSLYAGTYGFTYDSANDRSYWTMKFNWSWSSVPFFQFEDLIAVAWSPEMALVKDSSTYHTVTYVRDTDGTKTNKSWAFSLNDQPLRGAFSKFDMLYVGPFTAYFDEAMSGSGRVKVTKAGNVRDMGACFKYGHEEFGVTPSVSFPGSLSIDFSWDVNEEASYPFQYVR